MMDNACVCLDYDHDGPTVSTITTRRARKEHRCCECRKPILPGQQYEYVRGLWEETWSTYRTCRSCATIREDFMSCGFIYGELWESLYEAYREYNNPEATDWLEVPE